MRRLSDYSISNIEERTFIECTEVTISYCCPKREVMVDTTTVEAPEDIPSIWKHQIASGVIFVTPF